MRTLYPPSEAWDNFSLKVSDLHTLHVEQAGNPKGQPVVFLHGGPGGGIEPNHRQYFDPDKWRIILFDQRGCGKSTPHGCLEENTTWDLVADIERIRERLDVNKWHVFGGSWGSTLALAYAETHPERVKGLILRGIFLVRKQEIDWFYQYGASEIYPDRWQAFLEPIPPSEHHDLAAAYHKRLTQSDEKVLYAAARAWSIWEGSTAKLIPQASTIERFAESSFAYAFARIESHYFHNRGFFQEDGWLLKNANRLANIDGIIVQGRYDMCCPTRSAWDLHQAWPRSQLKIIPDAGHSASEPGIIDALIQATDHFAKPGAN